MLAEVPPLDTPVPKVLATRLSEVRAVVIAICGRFTDMGRDKLGKGCKFRFFFLGVSIEGDCDVWVWGIPSCVTSKFEVSSRGVFFVWSPVKGAPLASIWGSFFIKDMESISDRCRSFEDEMVIFFMGKSPL